ncbi:MAG: ABC transporter permease [Cytophagales bacterium]|nr:ABC transporter permease [Armatimonadota bacterium]
MQFTGPDILYNLLALAAFGLLLTAVVRARRQPLWAEAYRRLARNRIAMVTLAVLVLYGLVALLDSVGGTVTKTQTRHTLMDALFQRPAERTYSAPLASMTTGEPKPRRLNQPGTHLLGTDLLGNDVLYQTLKGARTAVVVGGFTSLMSVPVALLLGLLAGYYGRRVDDAVQYTYTVLSSIPDLLLLIAILIMLGPGLTQICVALAVTNFVGLCRLVRGETLKHRDREYVRAAKALGVSDNRILWRHILPNLLPVVIISVTLGFSGLVLAESTLSYLGVGVGQDVGSWGNMIDAARAELARDPIIWWNLSAASVALTLLALSLNLFGDALRDAIDPRLRS